MKKLSVPGNPWILGLLMLGLAACQKEDGFDSSDLGGAENAAMAEQYTDDMGNIIDDAYASSGTALSTYRLSGPQEAAIVLSECATVTRDTVSLPQVITVDFGPVNCLCRDGRYRRGKIIATFSGPYRAQGTVITHTTADYYVNDNQVDAVRIVTNLGRNDHNNLHYGVEVQATITLANGEGTITHEADRDREWILGEGTPGRLDDVYLIRGTGHSTSANGVEYHSVILSPLRKEVGFRFIIAGIEKVVRVAEETRVATMDFGYPNGERDDLCLVTFGNGRTRVVHLR